MDEVFHNVSYPPRTLAIILEARRTTELMGERRNGLLQHVFLGGF